MWRAIAAVTRRFHPRGTDRLLRLIAPPERPPNVQTELLLSCGYKVAVDTRDFLDWSVFFFGSYQPDVAALIERHLPIGGVAVDVGANSGLMTLAMAQRASQVLSVEPFEGMRQKLERNLALNRINHVTVCACALSDFVGEGRFHSPDVHHANQSNGYLADDGIATRVTTLDTLCDGWARLDVVKIDVEGHEGRVLHGGAATLSRLRPTIIFEYDRHAWQRSPYSYRDIFNLLHSLGYDLPASPNAESMDICATHRH